MSSESLSQIFKILFQIEDINIFVLDGVVFSRSVLQKAHFLTKNASAVKSEAHPVVE